MHSKKLVPSVTALLFSAIILICLLPTGRTYAQTYATLLYTFNNKGILETTGQVQNTTSPYFWVSSGGRLIMPDGNIGETIQGKLATGDPDQIAYNRVNPLDTDHGYYPQNTFRLVTLSTWNNLEEQVSFRITHQNLTDTPNRGGYSGIFLFSRHTDQYNLYYAGLRDDGLAVIKKKVKGEYYTLAYTQVFGDFTKYHKWSNPSFLPEDQWMGLKSRTVTNLDGSVTITLYMDRYNNGNWTAVLSTKDTGTDGSILRAAGNGGIRTDYMDVQFQNFKLTAI